VGKNPRGGKGGKKATFGEKLEIPRRPFKPEGRLYNKLGAEKSAGLVGATTLMAGKKAGVGTRGGLA